MSPDVTQAAAIEISVPFSASVYRATVTGGFLVWERSTGGPFILLNFYDLSSPATDTLGELATVMTAEAPDFLNITVQLPFASSDASLSLIEQIVVAQVGAPGDLVGIVP